MRVLAVTISLLAVLALPAHAQRGQQSKEDAAKQAADEKKKARKNDKAYQDALKKIPDAKEKYDPWAVTKIPDGGKKPSK